MNTEYDFKYMQQALELAARALGRTSPNPVVGAVIVKDGVIVGQGFHKKAGTPHAEVHALNEAGTNANGATMYVTLEPCSHYGKTPPCAHAIVKAGVKRVVIATLDPNPKVAGRGLQILQEAGIYTTVGVLEDEAKKLNEAFFKYITTGKPFVSLKYAMTLDGKIATVTGDSRWISGESSREYVHKMRNKYDAIMVGIGTVLKDDPQLNCRLKIDDKKDPVRVIIDGGLDIPVDSKIVESSNEQKTIIFTSHKINPEKKSILEGKGIEIIGIEGEPELLSVENGLEILAQKGICSVIAEGGAELNSYLLTKKLVDKIYCFIAPKIIGGNAPSPVGGQGISLMKDAYELQAVEFFQIDDDILIKAYTGW